jgi:hypothetical protein
VLTGAEPLVVICRVLHDVASSATDITAHSRMCVLSLRVLFLIVLVLL